MNDNTNTCGGTLVVTGSGFTKGEEVQIAVTGIPGTKGTIKIGTAVGTAKGKNGTINIQIPYSLGSGCAFNAGSVLITVHAADKSKHKASAETSIKKCQIEWTACPA